MATYAIAPGLNSAMAGPITFASFTPAPSMSGGGITASPVLPMFIINGNGVTLVTGQGAAGARPTHGQQWARGSHVVITQYTGVGQR